MRNLLGKAVIWLKRPWIAAGLIVIVGGGAVSYQFLKQPDYDFMTVEKGTLMQGVSVSGKVNSAEELELSFEKSGKVSRVFRQVGDKVRAGDIVVALNSSDLSAQLASARAAVDAAEARLDELKRGTRPEELAIKQTALDEAKLSLSNSYSGAPSALENAYISADDAIRRQADAFFIRDEELNPGLAFTTLNIQAQIDSENTRAVLTRTLNNWKSEISALHAGSSPEDLETGISKAETNLLSTQTFLKRLSDALAQNFNMSSATLTSLQTSLNTARTEVSVSITAMSSLKQTLASEKLAIQQAENNLTLAKAGSSAETIRAQEAQVASAQANAAELEAQLAKTAIHAPISGIITKQEAKIGQIVLPQSQVVSMMSDSRFQVEANVPETEVGKVKVGDPVRITLDAFPEEEFSGRIISVDPAETLVDGAVNYKIKAAFDQEDQRVKSGFSANVDVRTLSKDNALLIPLYAVSREDGKAMVRKLEGGKVRSVPVILGMRGQNGLVEVLEGISEGDRIVTEKAQ